MPPLYAHSQHPDVDACVWFSGTMTLMSAMPKKVRLSSPLLLGLGMDGK